MNQNFTGILEKFFDKYVVGRFNHITLGVQLSKESVHNSGTNQHNRIIIFNQLMPFKEVAKDNLSVVIFGDLCLTNKKFFHPDTKFAANRLTEFYDGLIELIVPAYNDEYLFRLLFQVPSTFKKFNP